MTLFYYYFWVHIISSHFPTNFPQIQNMKFPAPITYVLKVFHLLWCTASVFSKANYQFINRPATLGCPLHIQNIESQLKKTRPGKAVSYMLSLRPWFIFCHQATDSVASQLKPAVKLPASKAKGGGLSFSQYSAEPAAGKKLVETQGFLSDCHRILRETPLWTCKHGQLHHKDNHRRDTGRAEMRPADIRAQAHLILGYHTLLSVMRWLWTPWKSGNHSKQWIKPRVKKTTKCLQTNCKWKERLNIINKFFFTSNSLSSHVVSNVLFAFRLLM